ncbi:hypothetical protein [Bradyrhizobium sp. USDA 4522]
MQDNAHTSKVYTCVGKSFQNSNVQPCRRTTTAERNRPLHHWFLHQIFCMAYSLIKFLNRVKLKDWSFAGSAGFRPHRMPLNPTRQLIDRSVAKHDTCDGTVDVEVRRLLEPADRTGRTPAKSSSKRIAVWPAHL